MARIKAEIIVKGKVQKAGYRDQVQETARELDIKGYVENLKDGTVKIVCETDEKTLEKFIQAVNLQTDFVFVESTRVTKTQPATNEYGYFDIKHGSLEEELGERMIAGFKMAVATRIDMKNMHQGLKTSIGSMHEDLKASIGSMHQDLKTGIGSMNQDLKDMHIDLKSSIDSMHQDMNSRFEEMAKRYDAISAELLKTREELKRSVDTLVELVHKFIREP